MQPWKNASYVGRLRKREHHQTETGSTSFAVNFVAPQPALSHAHSCSGLLFMTAATIPVMGDGLPTALRDMLGPEIEVLEWDDSAGSTALAKAVGIITYGHPRVDGALMDRVPNLKI